MNKPLLHCLVLVVAAGAAYRLGQLDPAIAQTVDAQGRGPTQPAPKVVQKPTEPTPLVFGEGGGTGSSNNGFIAVTGSYGVGTSVLYLVDTVNKHLSVYEARGGTQSMRRLVWVGARRIDLDLDVLGYRDESEYTFKELDDMFAHRRNAAEGGGLTVPGPAGAAGASAPGKGVARPPKRGK
jgi:hypothetical protein